MSTVTFTKKHLEKLPEIAEQLRQRDENEPATAASNCLACDGAGTVCCGCRRPESHCECAGGCIASDACEDCKGEGTKPAPREEYGGPVAGEADLRDDEPMPAWKVELVAKIQAVEAELQECDGDVSECKDALSEAKERHAGKVSDLRSLIRKLDKAEEPMPLLDSLDKPAPTRTDMAVGLADALIARRNGEPKNDAWRTTCIDDLQAYRLSPSIVAKLRDKSIETLGDLADFQEKHGEFWPKEIKGLGPAKAAKVTDALAGVLAIAP